MLQDFFYGLKILAKQRAFTAAALLTLALCIGANTAIFTVLEGVVLRKLPYPGSGELVSLYNIYPGVGISDFGANAVPDYLDRRPMRNVFSEVALIGNTGYEVGLGNSPERIRGMYVTPSYFTVLGAKPLLGRTFTEEEGTLGKEKVAVLSEGLWKDFFAGDPKAVGKDIRLSGSLYRIVGVLPASFGLPGDDVRVWTSFAFTPKQTSDEARHSNSWGMIARLKPGVRLAQAQERIDDLNRRNLDRFPQSKQLLLNVRFGTKVVNMKDELTRDVRPILYLLQIAVGAVLLIGCVNLANLMLVRSNVRMKEMAIRFSLGAGRWRIARQLLTESVVLALLGGAFGLGVGYAGVRLLSYLGAKDLPRGAAIGFDPGVLAFTATISLVAGIAFGCVPLFHVLHRDLNEVFRGSERSGTVGRGAMWARSVLVVCQFAFAFVLLIGAGLLTMSFARLLKVDPGFKPEGVTTAQMGLPRQRYQDDAPTRNFLGTVFERLAALPGVTSVGAATLLPFGGDNNSGVISIVGHPLGPGENPPVPAWNTVNVGYFKTMGIPVLQGRTFTESDGSDSQKAVVIDEYLARRYWPNGGAIGAHIMRGIQIGSEPAPDTCTIIGVVGRVKTSDLAQNKIVGQIYFHYKQYVPRSVFLAVKTARDHPEVISAMRSEVRRTDPEMPIYNVRAMAERVSGSVANRRAAMVLCLAFAGLAVLLAAIGVYGVLAYSVSQRTREFGIRVALGAGASEVLGMVFGQGLKLAAVGLVVGAAGALALTRLMSSLLFEVRPADPVVFLIVMLVLAAVAGVASLIPSARAMRIPPSVALRYE